MPCDGGRGLLGLDIFGRRCITSGIQESISGKDFVSQPLKRWQFLQDYTALWRNLSSMSGTTSRWKKTYVGSTSSPELRTSPSNPDNSPPQAQASRPSDHNLTSLSPTSHTSSLDTRISPTSSKSADLFAYYANLSKENSESSSVESAVTHVLNNGVKLESSDEVAFQQPTMAPSNDSEARDSAALSDDKKQEAADQRGFLKKVHLFRYITPFHMT